MYRKSESSTIWTILKSGWGCLVKMSLLHFQKSMKKKNKPIWEPCLGGCGTEIQGYIPSSVSLNDMAERTYSEPLCMSCRELSDRREFQGCTCKICSEGTLKKDCECFPLSCEQCLKVRVPRPAQLQLTKLIVQVMSAYYGTKNRSELISRLEAIYNLLHDETQ